MKFDFYCETPCGFKNIEIELQDFPSIGMRFNLQALINAKKPQQRIDLEVYEIEFPERKVHLKMI